MRTPPWLLQLPPLQRNILARLLKSAGYIHRYKILSGDIFGLILKNKMATTGIFVTFSKEYFDPSRARGIIGRDLKFAGNVHHNKSLPVSIYGLILKNKMATTDVSLMVIQEFSTF